PPTPASGEGADPERFLAALTSTGGTGTTVTPAGLADALSMFASTLVADDGPTPTSVVAPDVASFADAVDAGLRSAGLEPVRPDEPGGWRTASAGADLGVTSARLGVTSTGSVLIVS